MSEKEGGGEEKEKQHESKLLSASQCVSIDTFAAHISDAETTFENERVNSRSKSLSVKSRSFYIDHEMLDAHSMHKLNDSPSSLYESTESMPPVHSISHEGMTASMHRCEERPLKTLFDLNKRRYKAVFHPALKPVHNNKLSLDNVEKTMNTHVESYEKLNNGDDANATLVPDDSPKAPGGAESARSDDGGDEDAEVVAVLLNHMATPEEVRAALELSHSICMRLREALRSAESKLCETLSRPQVRDTCGNTADPLQLLLFKKIPFVRQASTTVSSAVLSSISASPAVRSVDSTAEKYIKSVTDEIPPHMGLGSSDAKEAGGHTGSERCSPQAVPEKSYSPPVSPRQSVRGQHVTHSIVGQSQLCEVDGEEVGSNAYSPCEELRRWRLEALQRGAVRQVLHEDK